MSNLYRVRQPVEEECVQGYVVAKGDRFYAVIYEGVDPSTGRERRRWHAAGGDRAEAERVAVVLAAEANANQRSVGLSLGRYLLETWLPAKRVNLRPSTWNGYRNIVELHIVPRVGRLLLRRLRAHHLESLYADLLANGRRDGKGGLDPKTVLDVHVILHKALRDACKRGLVVRNVASDAEAPKRRRPSDELRAWTATQLHAFLQVARGERLFPAFWLAANTGMRRGELLGLRWGEIDLTGGHLSVNRSLISVGYELYETRGKTTKSRRWIDLDDVTVSVLSRWRDVITHELGRDVSDNDHVFCTTTGGAVHPDRFTQIFKRLVATAPVPRLRLHDLRHTHATLLLKAGVPIKVVSERLGHTTPGFTMATYQHVLPGMQAEAARTFASVIAATGFNPVEEPVEAAGTR
jgi:integrase